LRKTPERFRKNFGKLQGKQQQRLEFFQAYGKPPQAAATKTTTVT
jgi:hypothetical protein